ncbi:MAG: ribose-phosphate diphosphokinase [Elusimicrobia bacterium]|nr:ribose-phosphate diphosphokinase [Elusimicrobiota bacterium]MBD3412749.1 ribose-phosphate diphosphokinase [Elusimicrobiota bacterium]
MFNSHKLKIFTGNAHRELAEEICSILHVALSQAYVGRFPDGEVQVQIKENVRGHDTFVVQPTCYRANENIMELLLLIDALRRASAWRITAVMPYFGYARADRKAEPRVPISSKLIANLLTAAGTDRVLTMDLHAGQIQGFFDIPVDHLYANPVLLEYFNDKMKDLGEFVIVSPDAGGTERARAFAKRMGSDLAIVDKRRLSPEEAEVMNIIGDVKKKNVLIIDDLIDTGGTLCKTAESLKQAGAKKIFAACAHGVLAANAIDKVNASMLEELVITNSIPQKKISKKIRVLSIGPMLGKAIKKIHNEESVSKLFVY